MSPYVPLCPHTSPPPVVPPGVVRALHSEGRVARLLCTETRPFLQGARLTALEMLHEGVPTTLIADSAAAAAIRERGVHGEGGRTEGGGWGGDTSEPSVGHSCPPPPPPKKKCPHPLLSPHP